ncbi:MAG TPA: DUF1844 domain-containing protein [Candidatus Polarisedimenticolaceae bacterium]|nr:DUF1844 domain-containing protein [Candidatus Polarisedimenticolaceae bacterium]
MGDREREDERGGPTEDSGVKVTDRRLFTSDGSLRQEIDEEDEGEQGRPAGRGEPPVGGATGFERRSLDEPAAVDFTMLINAMAQPALIFLGEVAHPGSGREEIDLEQARLQIDLLDVLRIKCRGNLSPEEDALLDRVLYELRMRYLARSNQASR